MYDLRILIFLGVVAFASPASSASMNVENGVTALKTGDYTAAITSFKAAAQSDADKTTALMGWGDALAGRGDMAGAQRLYREALALSPESRPLLIRLRNLGIGP
ncbi:MAG: Flp pilus assembly protein TadD [Alphaproteobacteria bacterium]|jgi:Flp pilus assembly protein TadD